MICCCFRGSCYHDSSIIGDKWTGADQKTLEIDMYGFYFPKSTHVTIECLTTVCTDENKSKCKNVSIVDVYR